MKIFDTHTHDYFSAFDENREEMLKTCKESNVVGKIQIGCDLHSSQQSLALAQQHKNMWSTVGVHPCDAEKNYTSIPEENSVRIIFDTFQKLLDTYPEKIVGVGETGFDFFHNDSPEMRNIQKIFFEAHLMFAQKNNLPLVIHTRDASQEMIAFLRTHKKFLTRKKNGVPGVFHCFSEDSSFAKIATEELGFFLGIGGTSTYKKNTHIREAIVQTDIRFLVTETDSPFLAPQKQRGKQNNSSYISEIITLIAEIKNIPEDECAEILLANAKKLFSVE